MSFDLQTLKNELNPEQFKAVTTIDGPILIIAGAGSVITHDIPDYAVVAGVPARIIRYRYSQEQIEACMDAMVLKNGCGRHVSTRESLVIHV